jgi:hypothetical protein
MILHNYVFESVVSYRLLNYNGPIVVIIEINGIHNNMDYAKFRNELLDLNVFLGCILGCNILGLSCIIIDCILL